jgi:photosystem II stability/assembly factor-like uncharacterized protein
MFPDPDTHRRRVHDEISFCLEHSLVQGITPRLLFLRQSFMLRLHFVALLLTPSCLAQLSPQIQKSNTTENLRGISVVSQKVAWASGTHGTYLRTTDGGNHWKVAQVPGGESLDFRDVEAFTADLAYLLAAGTGDQSRIYKTTDAGQHWFLQFTNQNPKGFFDCMAFWDSTHGIAVGDPVPATDGKLGFELIITEDGQSWRPILAARIPPAIESEGAFAASGSCIALLPSKTKKQIAPIRDPHIWFATGGPASRVFSSSDDGKTWQVTDTPIVHGAASTGIFSIAFQDSKHGVIAGGDYRQPTQDGPNLAFTTDGGKSWKLYPIHPQAFFSAATFDRKNSDRVLIVGPDYILDIPNGFDPAKTTSTKHPDLKLNAISPYPEGGGLFVGPKGVVVSIGYGRIKPRKTFALSFHKLF